MQSNELTVRRLLSIVLLLALILLAKIEDCAAGADLLRHLDPIDKYPVRQLGQGLVRIAFLHHLLLSLALVLVEDQDCILAEISDQTQGIA